MQVTALVCLAMALLRVSTAAADDGEEARIHYERGAELYDEGKYEEASVAFSRAYELKPSYKILYNIAQTDNVRGEYAAALGAYRRYLAEGGEALEAARRAEVETEITRLESLVGSLKVEGAIAGSYILVDGRRLGEAPFDGPLLVNLGERDVLIRKGAEELYHEVVRVAGGQELRIEVEQPQGAGPAGVPPDRDAGRDGASSARTRKIIGGVILGVAGAAAVVAGVTGGLALSARNDLQCDGNSCPGQQDEIDSARTRATLSTVFTCVSGVALVAGILLVAIHPMEEAPAVSVLPSASSGGAGLLIEGRF
jgi:hypothetical protein